MASIKMMIQSLETTLCKAQMAIKKAFAPRPKPSAAPAPADEEPAQHTEIRVVFESRLDVTERECMELFWEMDIPADLYIENAEDREKAADEMDCAQHCSDIIDADIRAAHRLARKYKSPFPVNLVGTWTYELRFKATQNVDYKALLKELKREKLAPSILNGGNSRKAAFIQHDVPIESNQCHSYNSGAFTNLGCKSSRLKI
jgi:hypothetical protein